MGELLSMCVGVYKLVNLEKNKLVN